MNRLDCTQISDPSKQQPLLGQSITFIQDAYKEILRGIGQSMVGDTYSSSVGYCLYGGLTAGSNITTGFYLYDGEIYRFNGQSRSGWSNAGVFTLLEASNSPDPITFSDNTTGNVHFSRRLQLVDQADGTGLFNFSDVVFYQKRIIHTKVVDIGDWNMDSTATLTVAHGLTLSKIRRVSVVIRGDTNNQVQSLDYAFSGAVAGSYYVLSGNIELSREASGFYDNTQYDATGYNRGWITIEYVD